MSPLQHLVSRKLHLTWMRELPRLLSWYLQRYENGTRPARPLSMTAPHKFTPGRLDYYQQSCCEVCGSSPEVCAYRQSQAGYHYNMNEDSDMTASDPVSPPPYTVTNDSITVLIRGTPTTVVSGTPQFAGLRKCILEERWGDLDQYLTREGALARYLSATEFRVEGEKIYDYSGAELPKEIAARIIAMASAGEDPGPVVEFYKRLALNPSRRSVQQLFSFLGHCGIPLQPNGTFLAYKGVREDFLDQHSGTLLNTPGTTQRMPRNQISDDPAQSCHEGLHVGALEYARGFSSRVVICEIDPQHVVCVPNDCSCQKMRVCEYKVVANYVSESDKDVLPSTTHAADVAPDEDDSEWGGDVEHTDDDLSDAADEPIPFVPTGAERLAQEMRDGTVQFASEPKPVRAKVAITSRPTAPRAATFNRKSPRALMESSIEDLRRYASAHLKIMGASHIPGGKSKLVSAILRARRKKARK